MRGRGWCWGLSRRVGGWVHASDGARQLALLAQQDAHGNFLLLKNISVPPVPGMRDWLAQDALAAARNYITVVDERLRRWKGVAKGAAVLTLRLVSHLLLREHSSCAQHVQQHMLQERC